MRHKLIISYIEMHNKKHTLDCFHACHVVIFCRKKNRERVNQGWKGHTSLSRDLVQNVIKMQKLYLFLFYFSGIIGNVLSKGDNARHPFHFIVTLNSFALHSQTLLRRNYQLMINYVLTFLKSST